MPSYTDINYALRPAKTIERKMFAETFRRLSWFDPVEQYQYVGFGSIYFSDFYLFHKSLGITKMVSIEHNEADAKRFSFNVPFSCIDLIIDSSNNVLPGIDWNCRTILWLDYDDPLNREALTDVQTFFTNAHSGSILLITVPVHPSFDLRKDLEKLKNEVGIEKVPIDVTPRNMGGWGTAQVCYRIIINQIGDTISQRNGARNPDKKFVFKQLFRFHYQDGAKMLTVGGLLYRRNQEAKVRKCNFEELPYIRGENQEAYTIIEPKLTYREIRHLDTQLPISNHEDLKAASIPLDDLERYARLYRYFPLFGETDV